MSSRNNNISFPSRSNIANLFPVRSVKISIFRSFSVPQRRRERLPSLPVLFIFGWSDVTPVPSSPNLKSFRSRTNAHFWFASHTTSARTISIPLTGHVIPVSRPVLISRSSRPVLSRPIRTLGKYLSPSVKMSFSRSIPIPQRRRVSDSHLDPLFLIRRYSCPVRPVVVC